MACYRVGFTGLDISINLVHNLALRHGLFRLSAPAYITHRTFAGPNLAISSLEIARLPPCTFDGRIIIINVLEDEQRIESLFREDTLLGFDTESRPNTAVSPNNEIAVIQLASENAACLWRISQLKCMPPILKSLLEDPAKYKVAQGATQEVRALQQSWGINVKSCIDLYHMALHLRTTPRSLQGLVAIFMSKRLEKLQQTTNWEQETLSKPQIEYAATDAWASRQVLVEIRKAYSTERLECEKPVNSLLLENNLEAQPPREPVALLNAALRGDGASALASNDEGQNQQDGVTNDEQSQQQELAALCIAHGYVLRFEGFDSAANGYRCIFRVEYRCAGSSFSEEFRSKRAHSTIRAAQNDAALEALHRMREVRAANGATGTGRKQKEM